MRKILIGIILLINGYCYASDYRMASSLSITGGTLTGDLTAPNITATYGVQASSGTFGGILGAYTPAKIIQSGYTSNSGLVINSTDSSRYFSIATGGNNAGDMFTAYTNQQFGFNFAPYFMNGSNHQTGKIAGFGDNNNYHIGYYSPLNQLQCGRGSLNSNVIWNVSNSSFNVTSGLFSVGESTLTVANGNVGISSSTPMGLLTVGAGASFFRVNSTGQIFANSLGAAGTGTALVISATNEIIPLTSSRRFKNNIVPMKVSSDKLSLLKPVEFDYKSGGHAIGFIAEDVVKIYPSVVNKDKEGKPYSISYDQFIPILVDKINKLEARIKVLEGK